MLDETRSGIGAGVAKEVSPVSGRSCWYCAQWFIWEGCVVTWVDEAITQRQ